LIALKL
jgi:hypothetical protein